MEVSPGQWNKSPEVQDRRTGVWTLELLMMRIVLEGWQIMTVDDETITWEGGVELKEQTLGGR